jgi:hypothetical protein
MGCRLCVRAERLGWCAWFSERQAHRSPLVVSYGAGLRSVRSLNHFFEAAKPIGGSVSPGAVSRDGVAMKPAFGDQRAWRFFYAWLCPGQSGHVGYIKNMRSDGIERSYACY